MSVGPRQIRKERWKGDAVVVMIPVNDVLRRQLEVVVKKCLERKVRHIFGKYVATNTVRKALEICVPNYFSRVDVEDV